MNNKKIGFVGVGKMGGVLARAILDRNLILPENLLLCERIREKIEPFLEAGSRSCSIVELTQQANIIIIAVKPGDIKEVLELMRGKLNPSQIVVSIVTGATISFISRITGNCAPVIRIMPNSPIFVGEGLCALSRGPGVDEGKLSVVLKIFQPLGEIVEVPEEKMDAVTGLSGSGPAYIYTTIQGLIKGGEKAGLTREVSRKLAVQTVLGAAKLAKQSNKTLQELISSVATPGGTTIEGLKILKRGKFVNLLSQAVVRAAQKAKEISKNIEKI